MILQNSSVVPGSTVLLRHTIALSFSIGAKHLATFFTSDKFAFKFLVNGVPTVTRNTSQSFAYE